MGNRKQELRQGFLWTDDAHGLRTGIRNNSVVSLRSTPDGPGSLRPSICIAYGYSLLATVGFAALGSLAGSPSIRQMFLYGIGASVGFALVEAVASHGFRERLPSEATDVVMLGSAINVLSISAGLSVIAGLGSLWRWWLAWLLGPFAGTVVHLLVVGFEFAFARRAERVRQHS